MNDTAPVRTRFDHARCNRAQESAMSEPATQSAESQLEQRRSAASCAIAFAEFEGSTVSDEARAIQE
jgi:uncharacterized protein involved in copper resistance